MRDLKYIIKRIIIGVGIVFVLSCLNGCKVKAEELDYSFDISNLHEAYPNLYTTDTCSFSFNRDESLLYYMVFFRYMNVNDISNWQIYIFETNSIPNNFPALNTGGTVANGFYFNSNYSSYNMVSDSFRGKRTRLNCFNNTVYNSSTISGLNFSAGQNSGNVYLNQVLSTSPNDLLTVSKPYTANNYFIIDGNISHKNNNQLILDLQPFIENNGNQANISIPSFLSFNAIPITYKDVITSYTIQPEFTNFDTDNYTYQYSFDSNRWLSLTENKQILRINNNSTIYVRVKDKNTNEIIDSATFTISNIGTFYDEQTYDIKFSGEYRTTNYLSNNVSSKSSSIISEYQIYIDYLPKSSILTYQYQYVPTDSQLDNNNWQNVSSSDNGSITYVASQNGILYARILDKENNVLKTGTFTVNSIGSLAFDNNNSKFNDFYTSLRNKIDFGGPIGSLINIPITLLQTISDSFNGMTGVCSNYNLGNLFGYNLYLPCVNIKHYLGDTLYNTIDIIISCVMIYFIFKMLSSAYYQFLLLESTPIPEDMSNSLNVSYRGW